MMTIFITFVIKSEKLLFTYINMGRWSELMITSRSPRYCFSSEDCKEAIRDSYSSKYNDIIEEKLISLIKLFIIRLLLLNIKAPK